MKNKFSNIVVTPPGPKAREILRKDDQLISPSIIRFYPLVAETGSGCIIKDVDGNSYIDFNSGLAVLNVGHNHPKIVAAIKKQAEKLIHYSYTDFYYEEVTALAEELSKITPGKFNKKIYFGNSGAEAIEAAMKLARWHTRKPYYISFIGAFHGRTMGALSLTASKPVQRRHFSPLIPSVYHVPYPYCYRCIFKLDPSDCGSHCINFIEEMVFQRFVPPEDVAAIFFEPIQGEGGHIVPPPQYLQKLRRLADKYDILLVDDEIQSGIGRTGRWFAVEHWGIEPDIVCVAKAIASGLPLSAVIARSEIMDWEGGSHASTFGANPVACASALAVLEVIREEKLLDNATKQGHYAMKRLNEISEKFELIGDVRGKGLMIGVELVKNKKTKAPAREEVRKVMEKCWKRGLAIITCGASTIRIAPPLTISSEIVDEALEILESAIKDVEKEILL
jgi:4-aminobutyrate aminotransferase